MNNLNIHETLKRMRKTCKISQVRIGALLDLNQAGVSRIENGSQQISIEWLVHLSKFYQVEIDCIISGRVNYWDLAKRFNASIPLSKKYLADQGALVREVWPLLQYFSDIYPFETLNKLLTELGLQDILLMDPDTKISVHCVLDIIDSAVQKKLVAFNEVSSLVEIALKNLDDLPMSQLLKRAHNSQEIVDTWIINSPLYEGLFIQKVKSSSEKEQVLSLELSNDLKNQRPQSSQVKEFLLRYKTEFLENLPLHFGHSKLEAELIESPFESKRGAGLLRLIS